MCQVSNDMVNGTLGIFKTIWSLVDKACENSHLKEVAASGELENWNSKLSICRNSQLVMVDLFFL